MNLDTGQVLNKCSVVCFLFPSLTFIPITVLESQGQRAYYSMADRRLEKNQVSMGWQLWEFGCSGDGCC